MGGLSLTESGGEWGDAMYRVEEWHRVSGRWWDVSGRGPRGRFALIDKGGARVGGGVEMDFGEWEYFYNHIAILGILL